MSQSLSELITFGLSKIRSRDTSTSGHSSAFEVPLNLFGSIRPESLVASECLS
jgi:hypothetical protein